MPLLKEHWTLRYVLARSAVAARRRLRPSEPWLTPAAIRMLQRFLTPDHAGIEFGCGISTVWLARRCGRLVSVEHDPEWHAATLGRLRSIEASNVELRLCPTGAEYVAAAEDPGPFDFALVDGKRRAAVAPRIARSISPGGLLVLDNADRYDGSPEWAPFREAVSDWTCFRTSNGVWRTDLYRRHRAASITS